MDGMLKRCARGPVITLVTGLIICVIVAVQTLALLKSRQDTWAEADRSAQNVLHTLAAAIDRNLTIIELSMSGVEEALGINGLWALDPNVRHLLLFDRAASAQFLGSMLVLDDQGNIVFDSGSVVPRTGNFHDRDYFVAQREAPIGGSFLSKPYASRLRQRDPSIGLSRRLSRADGSFNGIVLAAIRIAFFKSLFDKVNLGVESAITLLRTDGTVIYRSPSTDDAGNVGLNVADSPVVQQMLATPGKPFQGRSKIDNVQRYYVHQRIAGYPLILVVGFSASEVYAEWNAQALALSALTFAVCLLLALVVYVLKRALLRSYEMEEQLEHMAVTDVLTQIPNRRALNMALDTEMRRAAREKTELSVLIVDIDHFKRINDSYGHAFGDTLLRQVSRQVVRGIRRPGDFAARFGGEEFVVILPATGQAGATFIAERIRAAIEATTVPTDDGSKVGCTVSVGAATGRVRPDVAADELLRRADEALYAAKSMGRNRVMGSGVASRHERAAQ